MRPFQLHFTKDWGPEISNKQVDRQTLLATASLVAVRVKTLLATVDWMTGDKLNNKNKTKPVKSHPNDGERLKTTFTELISRRDFF